MSLSNMKVFNDYLKKVTIEMCIRDSFTTQRIVSRHRRLNDDQGSGVQARRLA